MIWGMQSASYGVFKDRLTPFLQNFADRSLGRMTVAEMEADILDTTKQVWVVDDFKAVALTSLGPDCVTIHCCSGSDREAWQDDLEAEITAWGRFKGCKRIFIFGRPGWSKWAKAKGYHEAHREMTRAI